MKLVKDVEPLMPKINTHPDVYVEKDRVGGVEFIVLWNTWLKCPIEITPAPTGFTWTATFKAIDTGEFQNFTGRAGNRTLAVNAALDVITRRIQTECRARKRWLDRYLHAQQLSIHADVPLALPSAPPAPENP